MGEGRDKIPELSLTPRFLFLPPPPLTPTDSPLPLPKPPWAARTWPELDCLWPSYYC